MKPSKLAVKLQHALAASQENLSDAMRERDAYKSELDANFRDVNARQLEEREVINLRSRNIALHQEITYLRETLARITMAGRFVTVTSQV